MAVGAGGLVVCIAVAPVGHDLLVVEQFPAGGALGAGGHVDVQLGSL